MKKRNMVILMAIVLILGITPAIIWPSIWALGVWLLAVGIFALIIVKKTDWGKPASVTCTCKEADVVSMRN